MLPETICGRYRILEELGRGGMGAVYLAQEAGRAEPVALKVLLDRRYSETGIRHFEEEFRTLTRLQHPNLTAVHDFGRVALPGDGRLVPFFTMEHVRGATIDRAVARRGFDVRWVGAALVQVAQALAYLHARGLLHRDVKPSNILVSEDADGAPRVKLMDLGLAGRAEARSEDGSLRGTVAYLSPEAIRGEGVDPRSDLYALGCVAYELAVGRPPFEGPDVLAVVRGHLTEAPIPCRVLGKDVPAAFDDLVARLLAKDPGRRPPNAVRAAELIAAAAGGGFVLESPEMRRSHVLGAGFVGREGELARLSGLLEASRGSPGALAVVAGEAGVGKTRLLRELQVRAQIDGFDVFIGRGGSFAEALGRAVRSRSGAAEAGAPQSATPLDRFLGDDPGPATPESERWGLLGAIGDAVDALARDAPLALAVDDLHLADETTCAVLRHLAIDAPRPRVALIGAYRVEEAGRSGALAELLSAARDAGALEEIAVGSLDGDETATLLRAMLGADALADGIAERVLAETRGNPLHLTELVGLLAEEGHVRPGADVPLDPAVLARVELPGRMRDVVARRVALLADDPREILEAAATLGGSVLDPDAVAVVAGARWEAVVRRLDGLVAPGLVARDGDVGGAPLYRIAHRGLVEIVREQTSPERARTLHERALDYLERRGVARRHDAWREVAGHAEAAGRVGRAIDAWGRAGDLAREVHALRDAVAAYGRAIELALRGGEAPATLSCGLYERRAGVHATRGDLARAEEDARWMLARAEKAELDPLRARAHLVLGTVLALRGAEGEAAEGLEVALAIAGRLGDRDLESAAGVALGRLAASLGRADEAASHLERAAEIAREAGLASREVEALCAEGALHRDRGDYRRSLTCFERAAARAGRLAPPSVAIAIQEGAALALEVQGKYREAAAAWSSARDRARETGDVRAVASLTASLGAARMKTGDDAGAREALEEALAAERRLGRREGVVGVLQHLAQLASHRGRLDDALEAADEALRQARRAGRRDLEASSLALLGGLRLHLGDLDPAAASLEQAHALLAAANAPRALAVVLVDLSDLRRRRGENAEARRCAQEATFLSRRLGDRRLEALALTRLGEAHLDENEHDRALVACRKSLALVEGSGLPREEADARLLRARVELTRPGGDVVRADMDALEALARYRDLGDVEPVWQAEHLAGKAALRLGRREEAVERFERAHRYLESVRSRLPESWVARWSADPRHAELAEDWRRVRAASREERAAEPPVPASEIARLRRDNAALRRLLDLDRTLGSTRDLEELLPRIVEAAVELTRAERGFLLLRDGEGTTVRVASGSAEPGPSRSVVGRVLAEGAALLATDVDADAALARAESVRAQGIRGVLAVPLRIGEETAGVVYLDSRVERGLFDETHLEIAGRLAAQAAIALDNARLLTRIEEQRAALDRLNRELERTAAAQRDELAEARERIVSTRSSLELRFRFRDLVGGAPAMQRVYQRIERLAPKRIAVLVVGESGTGKELIARALHETSDRSGGPFFTVNCAALPENLLESELFGFRRGAFTGADRNKPGYFELAHGGTLFLDEIGEMGLAMQAKLLRVLQEGEVLPVGGNAPVRVDVRIVSATNRDLQALIREGRFREDLYYRIHVARIDVPPLRERREDVPLLVDHFLAALAEQEGEAKREVEPAVLRRLAEGEWRGNVRELQHQIARLCALSRNATLTTRDLERYGDPGPERSLAPAAPTGVESLEEIERRQIERALAQARGNKTRAAELLGINRATLFRKLRRFAPDL